MGIKGLHPFMKKNFPNIYTVINLNKLSGKKIAIDISLYMFKYKATNADFWLTSFINLVCCLRKNNIHCVFIYDNGAPKEKELARGERDKNRMKQGDRIYNLEDEIGKYEEQQSDKDDKTSQQSSSPYPELDELVKKKPQFKNLLTDTINIDMVKDEIKRLKDQLIIIDKEDIALTKQLFDILKVPYFDAVEEAENNCAWLCKKKLVYGVLSEDSDLLAYGCPVFVTKIDIKTNTVTIIKYRNVLKETGFRSKQFTDFCIMNGCDYNKNIYRVGPVKAFSLLNQYKSIEGIENNTELDTTILNYKRTREIFLQPKGNEVDIDYCGIPDFKKLESYIVINNCKINFEYIKSCFVRKMEVCED